MAASTSSINDKMTCMACERDDTIIEAIYWCKDCKESICDDCVKSHKKLRLNHSIIPKDDVTEADILVSQLDLGENCQKHKREPLTMYCITDEEPCCTVCALSTHKACQEVVPLDELAENYSQLIKDKDTKCLHNMQKSLENIIKLKTAAEKDNNNLADQMVSRMTKLVGTIKQQMDDLLSGFISVVQKKKSESLVTNDKQMKMLQKIGQKLKTHSETMELFNNLDPRQCLIAGFAIKKDIAEQVKLLEENTQLITEVHLNFKVNEIINQLQKVQSLAVITEESQSRALLNMREIGNQSRSLQLGLIPIPSPQVACVSKRNLMAADVKLLKKITKEELNLGDLYLYSAIFLQDGQLLASDFEDTKNRLLMFDSNNDFQFTVTEYSVAGRPTGLCISPDNNIVHVVCDFERVVSYTLRGKWEEMSSFKTKTRTIGIGQSGTTLITGEEEQVVMQYMNGFQLSAVIGKNQDIDTLICTSENREKFYHRDGDSILCRNLKDGKEDFRYSHPSLNRPIGLSCDREGNILVAGTNSKNIHQISAGGQNGRILLDKFSSIKEPLAVCCHPHRDLFLVSSQNEDTVMEIYEFC